MAEETNVDAPSVASSPQEQSNPTRPTAADESKPSDSALGSVEGTPNEQSELPEEVATEGVCSTVCV